LTKLSKRPDLFSLTKGRWNPNS